MKRTLAVTAVLAVAVLAGAVAYRLSPDALALVVGVLLGLLAAAPAAGILVWVLRQHFLTARQTARYANPPIPPVIVVHAPQAPPAAVAHHQLPTPTGMDIPAQPMGPPMERIWAFRVVGEAPEENASESAQRSSVQVW